MSHALPVDNFRALLASMGYAAETLRPGHLRGAAVLIADALDLLSPDDPETEARAAILADDFRNLANYI